MKLAGKDERINELKHEVDSMRREYDSINQGNNQLRLRARELESNVNSYESVGNKSSLTIAALQRDAREKQEQLIELQSRLRYSPSSGSCVYTHEAYLLLGSIWMNEK